MQELEVYSRMGTEGFTRLVASIDKFRKMIFWG